MVFPPEHVKAARGAGSRDSRVPGHTGREIDLIPVGEAVDVRPLVAVRYGHRAGAHGTIHLRDTGQLTLRAASTRIPHTAVQIRQKLRTVRTSGSVIDTPKQLTRRWTPRWWPS